MSRTASGAMPCQSPSAAGESLRPITEDDAMHDRRRHPGTLLAGSLLVGGIAGLSVAFAMAIAMDPSADLMARDRRLDALERMIADADARIASLPAEAGDALAEATAALERMIDGRLDGYAEVVDGSLARESRERRGDDARLAGICNALAARVDAVASALDALARKPAPAPVATREVVERIVVRHEFIPVFPIYPAYPCR